MASQEATEITAAATWIEGACCDTIIILEVDTDQKFVHVDDDTTHCGVRAVVMVGPAPSQVYIATQAGPSQCSLPAWDQSTMHSLSDSLSH